MFSKLLEFFQNQKRDLVRSEPLQRLHGTRLQDGSLRTAQRSQEGAERESKVQGQSQGRQQDDCCEAELRLEQVQR